ncbi:MAG: ferredoxin family protein [Syntrophorhabdaceae bacterium]
MTKKVEEKIALNAMKNAPESHIILIQTICKGCKERMCIKVCPGHLYSLNEETGEMVVEYAGCLECGTCLIACTYKSITWEYPTGEYGVQYRYG